MMRWKKCTGFLVMLAVLLVSGCAWATVTVGGLTAVSVGTVSGNTFKYTPAAGASMDFTLDVAASILDAGNLISLDWKSNPAGIVYSEDAAIVDSTGEVTFPSQPLTFLQSGTGSLKLDTFANGKISVLISADLTSDDGVSPPAIYSKDITITFQPVATGFALKVPSTTIPLATKTLIVSADLTGTLSTDISWTASADSSAFSVTPTSVASQDIAFGFTGTKAQTFTLTGSPAAGDTLTITATLGHCADGSGNAPSKKLTLAITFQDAGDLKVEPTPVTAYLNCLLSQDLKVSAITPATGDTISVVSVDPVSWDSINVSGSGQTIRLNGTPSPDLGTRQFTVTANYNSVPKTVKFTVVVTKPSMTATPSSTSAKVGTALPSTTVTITPVPAAAVITDAVLVQPSNLKGLNAASLSSTTSAGSPITVVLGGTPTETGTLSYTVTGKVNGVETSIGFSVNIAAKDKDVEPADLVSTNPKNWGADLEPDGDFVMAARIDLPSGVTLADVSNVIATFAAGVATIDDTYLDYDDDGYLCVFIEGTLLSGKTASDLVLKVLQIITTSTTYEQTGIALSLQSILNAHKSSGGGGGCDAGFGLAALALAGVALVWKRRTR